MRESGRLDDFRRNPQQFIELAAQAINRCKRLALVERDEGERLYFVVETKASLFSDDLRSAESARIKCGRAHFNALRVGEAPARYEVAARLDDLLARMDSE